MDSFTLIFESEDKPKYIKYSLEYLKNKKNTVGSYTLSILGSLCTKRKSTSILQIKINAIAVLNEEFQC